MKFHSVPQFATLFRHIKTFIGKHRWLTLGLPGTALVAVVAVIIYSTLTIEPYKKYTLPADTPKHADVGIVMGAGVTKDGRPFRELQARLDVAATALQQGKVSMLLLSGDNRFKNYDEPGAMIRYLTETKHIAKDKLQADYAGRSTYETCERAAKVFELHQTIIFSAGSHLPRATYLCRHFGIEAYGISSNVEAKRSGLRESEARVKALYNVYIHGEPTILGAPIPLQPSTL